MAYVLIFRSMPQPIMTKSTPQFGTAEYAGKPDTEHCSICQQKLGKSFYRIDNALACAICAEQAKLSSPRDNHAAFVRGLLFAVGGAIVGLVLYAAVGIITGLEIGYVSLAVGYLVGKAMTTGSRGIGGRHYQIAAVLLTYAAVSIAAVPIGLAQYMKDKKAHPQAKVSTTQQAPATDQAASQQSGSESSAQDAEQSEAQATKPANLGAAIGKLALIGLTSPFYALKEGTSGLIGLVILFVGIQIAWRTTAGKPVEISGPFDNLAPASS